ncbi:efflux transporter outer membrane subunit [Novosphingobium sp. SG720]|uniref:efflux transporter outer membrane subunit n=1 Tax=Novosphingobium sp. SG720 TaxID=2586998 RepID=UPI0014469B98|nr:efflux transporter outer membrane subunit [Novosphingobium sp. SG720]NKJ42283.1 NodT family efflux transporter outer membrane factor (OMF) lipoprotein [Novosphingobium sp. SG720]
MRLAAILLAVSALSGCTAGRDYVPPKIALSRAYHAPVPIAAADAQWWRRFGDPVLDSLVEMALAQNLDVAAAAARVIQARAAVQESGAALLPQASVAASAERTRQSLRTPVGAVSSRLDLPRDYSLYTVGPQASWEIDLFGGLRRGREAARADFAAAAASEDAVRLSVAAETADAYLQLRGLQARYDVVSHELSTERQLADLLGQQAAQGLVAEREHQRVLGESAGLEATLAPLRAAIAGQINRLDVLTGQQAGSDLLHAAAAQPVPDAPDPSGSAIPGELMRRRPDLVAAERHLAASSARTGAAMADYYPRLSLNGLLGFASIGTGGLFAGNALQASGGAALRWRLFDFGRVDAEVAQARGKEAEALAQLRGSVLKATEEVETAITRLAETRAEIALRQQQVASLTRSRDQARQGYEGGALALIDVLDADRALLDANDHLAEARAQAARESVSAVRALGGGWEPRS